MLIYNRRHTFKFVRLRSSDPRHYDSSILNQAFDAMILVTCQNKDDLSDSK